MQTLATTGHLSDTLEQLISVDEPLVTGLANAAACVFEWLQDVNWAGFYLLRDCPVDAAGETLWLGPFCGKPACTSIPIGKGVCGTAAKQREVIRVADVDSFPGHIACDSASRSEIVLPLVGENGELFGVLDIDAPRVDRFTEEDQHALTAASRVIAKKMTAILGRSPHMETDGSRSARKLFI